MLFFLRKNSSTNTHYPSLVHGQICQMLLLLLGHPYYFWVHMHTHMHFSINFPQFLCYLCFISISEVMISTTLKFSVIKPRCYLWWICLVQDCKATGSFRIGVLWSYILLLLLIYGACCFSLANYTKKEKRKVMGHICFYQS